MILFSADMGRSRTVATPERGWCEWDTYWKLLFWLWFQYSHLL